MWRVRAQLSFYGFDFKTAHYHKPQLRDLAAYSAQVCHERPPSEKIRGRRECRAPDAPAASRANEKSTRASHHGHTGITRHSPRNGFNGFLRALPGDRALLPPSSADISANLTPASGRQDHTTSPSASAPLVRAPPKRPSHPAPNARDDRDTPLLRGRDARDVAADLGVRSMTPNAADWHDGQR